MLKTKKDLLKFEKRLKKGIKGLIKDIEQELGYSCGDFWKWKNGEAQ